MVSNMFLFSARKWGKWFNLTSICFKRSWYHQLLYNDLFFSSDNNMIHLIHWLVFHFFHNNNNMLIMLLPCEKGGRDKSTSFWVGIFLYVKRSSGGWLGLWQHDLDGSWSKNFWTVQDWKKIATRKHDRFPPKWGFPKLGVPNNHEFSYTKNDHFGVVWGYHHLRKQPNGGEK